MALSLRLTRIPPQPGRIPLALTLSLVFMLSLIFTPPLQASSGIRIGSFQKVDGSLCPACGETQTAVFSLQVKNTNSGFLACKEDVKITFEEIRACDPTGTCSVLGLSRSSDPATMTSGNLAFRLDDDSAETVYLGVETGPNGFGCDFLDMEVDVIVCDNGGPCIWDALDRPCEPPTAFRETLRVKTLESTCPSSEVGTATVSGIVYDAFGDPIRNARVELSRGCPGAASHVKLDTRTELTDVGTRVTGSYEFVNVPQALGYTLTVTEDGQTNSQVLDITTDSNTVDILF